MDYQREKAIAYAHEWAFKRNPAYVDFDPLGGDCTNFISQCLHAGGAVMNFTKDIGWYYRSLNSRAAAWTGVPFFHRFLTTNQEKGPHGKEVPLSQAMAGDVVQLSFDGDEWVHSLFIVSIDGAFATPESTRIACHTYDSDNRLLSTYWYQRMRAIHIEGIREK